MSRAGASFALSGVGRSAKAATIRSERSGCFGRPTARERRVRRFGPRAFALAALLSLPGFAQARDAGEPDTVEVPDDALPQGFTPPADSSAETLRFTGYVDVGFARATGNGSSFADSDQRVPLDYGVDAFAPAVNSRGDVASTDARGRFTNGFLPRSVAIGNRPSFLLNTASLDLRFNPRAAPVSVFVRAQAMPRWSPGGDATRFELQQAFGKLTPLSTQELALSAGRFDSVFGFEYTENEANLRPGITPSLTARYTTGHSLGVKVFSRVQLPALWSAVSLNAAATNGGTRVEELVPQSASLTGVPVGSARLGYELNLQHLQAKLGVSGLYGARNDQRSAGAMQAGFGLDARATAFGVSLAGELLRLVDDPGPLAGKFTGQGTAELASGFQVWGGWVRALWTLPWHGETLTALSVYGRYDARKAQFAGMAWVVTNRFTAGVRLDFTELLALKAEALWNRELAGAPTVDNDVFTSSAVFTW